MPKKKQDNVLNHYIQTIFTSDSQNIAVPLKDQSQVPLILDTLSRKHQHHLIIYGAFSEAYNRVYLDNIAQQFGEQSTRQGQESCFFILDVDRLLLSALSPDQLEEAFQQFHATLSKQYKRVLFAINQIAPLNTQETGTLLASLKKWIISVITDDQWRMLVATKSHPDQQPQTRARELPRHQRI